jgi:hypothetical protein
MAHVSFNQQLVSTIVDVKVVGRRDQHNSLRCPVKIVWKSRCPEQVDGIALVRIICFRPMEMEDIASLASQ